MALQRLSFFLMSQKGLQVLKGVYSQFGNNVFEFVVSSRDMAIEKDFYEEIMSFCLDVQIPFFERKDSPEVISAYTIAISWRWLISAQGGLIVLHDSLLPRYRGFAPLVNSLKNGEPEIGVTALVASEEYDKGEILGNKKVEVRYPLKISEAIDIVAPLYQLLVNELLEQLFSTGNLLSRPQIEEDATYSLWLDEGDYKIDWDNDSEFIARFVDAVGFPYNGATTEMERETIKILAGKVVPDVIIENRTSGKVIFMDNGRPVVVCGRGLYKIEEAVNSAGQSILPLKKFRVKFK